VAAHVQQDNLMLTAYTDVDVTELSLTGCSAGNALMLFVNWDAYDEWTASEITVTSSQDGAFTLVDFDGVKDNYGIAGDFYILRDISAGTHNITISFPTRQSGTDQLFLTGSLVEWSGLNGAVIASSTGTFSTLNDALQSTPATGANTTTVSSGNVSPGTTSTLFIMAGSASYSSDCNFTYDIASTTSIYDQPVTTSQNNFSLHYKTAQASGTYSVTATMDVAVEGAYVMLVAIEEGEDPGTGPVQTYYWNSYDNRPSGDSGCSTGLVRAV